MAAIPAEPPNLTLAIRDSGACFLCGQAPLWPLFRHRWACVWFLAVVVGSKAQCRGMKPPRIPRPQQRLSGTAKSAVQQQQTTPAQPHNPSATSKPIDLSATTLNTSYTRSLPRASSSGDLSTSSALTEPPLATIETHHVDDDASADGNDSIYLWNSPTKNSSERVLETDYYQNPTLLSRLILNQKYGSALRRLYSTPVEARIWLCSQRATPGTPTRKDSERYSIRQLPIHMACSNIVCTHDIRASRQLNELIATLVFTHPKGAHLPDHKGRLPLHEAIWYGADPRTLSIFLMSKPEALLMKDHKGRSLMDLNQHRSGLRKEEVRQLLQKGLNFWRTARDEAFVRFRQGDNSRLDATSVSSLAALASNGSESCHDEAPPQQQPITSLSWDQLERRALTAERILSETVEKNYELSRQVNETTSAEDVQCREMLQEITRIGSENALLTRKVRELEKIIEANIISGADDTLAQQQRLALAEVSSLVGLSEATSLSGIATETPRLSDEIRKLSQTVACKQQQQREHIRKVKFVIESMMSGGDSTSAASISALSFRTEGDRKSVV